MNSITLRPIGTLRTPFSSGPGTPRQAAGAEEVRASIEIASDLLPALKDLDGFSHIVVVFYFHLSPKTELIAHPPWADATPGVFASCSPYRPSRIGVSIVRLESIDDGTLHIRGADMMDGTPVLDIKPYVPQLNPQGPIAIGWLAENLDGMIKGHSGDGGQAGR